MTEEHGHSLHPPQLFSVGVSRSLTNSRMLNSVYQIVKKDVAQPDKRELDEALEKSRLYWFHLASLAYAQRDHGLSANNTDPRHALRRVPSFQARPKKTHCCPLGASPLSLCLEASSTWEVSANTDCDELEKTSVEVRPITTRQ